MINFIRNNHIKNPNIPGKSSGGRSVVPETPQQEHEDGSSVHNVMEALHVGIEASDALGLGGFIARAGTGATVVSGVYFGIEGARDLKEAIKKKDLVQGLEGTAHLGLAGESAAETLITVANSSILSGMIGPAGVAIAKSGAMQAISTSLGVLHGGAELVLGGREIYQGIRGKDRQKVLTGALNATIGVGCSAVALGGGIPVGVALISAFGLKMAVKNRHLIGSFLVKTKNRLMNKTESVARLCIDRIQDFIIAKE